MPRRQRELVRDVGAGTPRTIVASSVNYTKVKAARIYTENDREWQKQCYRHYRICGEARFAASFFGHALSRVRLYVESDPYDADKEEITDGPAVEYLRELFGGSDGQAAMLTAFGIHLTVAGECYLIGRLDKATGEDIWEVRSVLEIKSNNLGGKEQKWSILQPGVVGAATQIDLGPEDTVIRIWIPDPQNAANADSPFRSLLTILDEIEWLTKYVFAQCSSRLGGAGAWLVPEEMDMPEPPEDPDDPEASENRTKADNLMHMLAENILKPIEDPSNPAAKVPLVITAPGEYIANAQWITFWSELDSEAKTLRGEAIQRFALGMDLPMERILGMSSNMGGTSRGGGGGVSHWGAWQIDEDTIKMHVEPMLDVVTQALSVEYLQPALGEGHTEVVCYDTTKLRLRPDRSAEALELYDRGLLKGEVAVVENGFQAADMPTDAERNQWLLMKVATNTATPEMVAAALKLLGADLGPVDPGDTPIESRPTPAIGPRERDLPNPEDSDAGNPNHNNYALVAACDALAYRAMERAGARLRNKGVKPPADFANHEVHLSAPGLTQGAAAELLTDAWANAVPVLQGAGFDPATVLPALNNYALSLLVTTRPHNRDALIAWLARDARKS